MKYEEIKVGETYNVRMRVISIDRGIITAETVLEQDGEWGIQCGEEYEICVDEAESFSPIPTPSKHDPTRLFKKGDIVEIDIHGRDIAASMKKSGVELGKRYTVTEDENNTGYVSFIGEDGIEHHSMFFWLKLVTPVEELESYRVEELDNAWVVRKGEEADTYSTQAWYCKKRHPHAKEAAEAERDRLNAEWRKEQE